jgi:hypothetical protein
MATFTVHQAKTELSKLMARAEAGEEIVIARRDKGENRPRFTVATLAFAPGHWEAFVASQENMWGGGARLPDGPTALFLVKRCPSAAHRRRVCPLALSLCPKAVGAGHQQGRNLWDMIPRPRSRCKASPDAAVLPGQPGGHPSPTKNSTDIISEAAKGVDDRNFQESCKPLKSWERICSVGGNPHYTTVIWREVGNQLE